MILASTCCRQLQSPRVDRSDSSVPTGAMCPSYSNVSGSIPPEDPDSADTANIHNCCTKMDDVHHMNLPDSEHGPSKQAKAAMDKTIREAQLKALHAARPGQPGASSLVDALIKMSAEVSLDSVPSIAYSLQWHAASDSTASSCSTLGSALGRLSSDDKVPTSSASHSSHSSNYSAHEGTISAAVSSSTCTAAGPQACRAGDISGTASSNCSEEVSTHTAAQIVPEAARGISPEFAALFPVPMEDCGTVPEGTITMTATMPKEEKKPRTLLQSGTAADAATLPALPVFGKVYIFKYLASPDLSANARGMSCKSEV